MSVELPVSHACLQKPQEALPLESGWRVSHMSPSHHPTKGRLALKWPVMRTLFRDGMSIRTGVPK